ncbi:CBS domain-containing protein [Taibaiella soli]|uniref:CBS domain-containing protein n=1 Tax=Taibaiella soli TaxID=1649169 RepID=A0A2W2BND5_9BACT|nr:CBS domain-containing protein [Taibaiella soli]PZF74946.1 CBS domain-containing protein [Taibaiella soli]
MKKRELISHIMTTDLTTVTRENSLRDVKHILSDHKIRHIPVIENQKLIGIISRTDIMRLSFGSLFENQENADEAMFDMLRIEQVMASRPETVRSDMTIRDVAQLLTEKEFHALPVVDNGELKGIVTTTDIIKYLVEQY